MEIREITSSELDKLLDLYLHLHKSDDPLPEKKQIEMIWREIKENPRLKYFGLYVNDQLVSSCTLSIIPNLTRGCKSYGLIENVVTHKDYRQKGFGKRILEYTLKYAWEENCYKVMLLTGRKSEAIYRFYESAGFDRHEKQAFIARPNKIQK